MYTKAGDLFYTYEGENGPPLVCIGGFCNDTTIWSSIEQQLQKRYRVVLLDNRGAGRSTTHPPFSIEQFADDTAALMEELQISSVPCISLSMGTLIAQALALRHPGKISRGIWISPFSFLPRTAYAQANAHLQLLQAGVDPTLIQPLLLPWLYSSTFLEGSLEKLPDFPLPSLSGYRGQLEAMAHANFEKDLPSISIPVLLITGEEDICISPRIAESMAEKLPCAHIQKIPKAGHLPHIENPPLVVEGIFDFLQAHL